MLSLAILFIAPSSGLPDEVWRGDFTLTIQGQGKAKGPSPNTGNWDIHREARGTIILDRSFAGGGIAGTSDSNNTTRYQAWVSTSKRPIEMRIRDTIGVYGPLFAPNQIRQDTYRYTCPLEATKEWQPGKVGTPILQFDLKEGTYTFESPRIYAQVEDHFHRDFVKGPPKWTSTKPIDKKVMELEFEMIHGLNQPKEWFKMSGPYRPDMKKIVLTRSLPFSVPLGASIPGQALKAEWKLVLEKQ